jgi:GTPase SAR1 family protein
MALLDRFERFLDQVIPPPDEVAAAVRRGEGLLAAGAAEGALRTADDALAVAPGFLRALTLRVDALAALGRDAEALASLDTAHRERVLPADALARMVELAARTGDEHRALELETHARARLRGRDPVVARRLVDGARALLARGREASALRLARGATLADPTMGIAWLLLGHDAMTRGDRALARRALDRGVTGLDASDAGANRLAGEIAWGIGDRATAARCLRRAWITGDDGAIATLVAVLAAGDESDALERVLADARGELGDVARGLLGIARSQGVDPALDRVRGEDVPDVLWHYALDLALRSAPQLATRWCFEAPDRPAARAVLALAEACARIDGGSPAEATASLELPLSEPTTRPFARDALHEAWSRSWEGRLGPMLEALAAVVGAREGASQSLAASLRACRRELDEPLRVVLLGEFSAGKSTFLNALVGAEVSPMGVLPTTAHVHWLRHGDRGAKVFDRRGGVVEASLEEVSRVVARRRDDGVGVDYVEVTLPLSRLARMEVIDTPGFNSGDDSHEDAVRRAFELADLAVWLFDARQAGRHSESGPLAEARARGLPVVGVLNKIDQVPEASRAELLAYVRGGFEGLAPCVLAVSARLGLAASTEADEGARATLLREGGWTALLRYFDEHLVAQRSAWKRVRVAGRARALVAEARGELALEEARAESRRVACSALGEALQSLREALARTGPTLRREVELSLRDQFRAVDDRAGDREALVADAVAEVGWRARSRALASLSPRMREVERLGVEVGLCARDASELLTAPLIQWLDHAVADGARDASAPATAPRAEGNAAFLPSDPLAWLESAADRASRRPDAPVDALRVALDVALDRLADFTTPTLPVPSLVGAAAG